MLNIIATLKCGLEVTKGHWKWCHSKVCNYQRSSQVRSTQCRHSCCASSSTYSYLTWHAWWIHRCVKADCQTHRNMQSSPRSWSGWDLTPRPWQTTGRCLTWPSCRRSIAISEIVSTKEWPDLEICVWSYSRSLKMALFIDHVRLSVGLPL